jgi:hypothetical protein
VTLRQLDFQVFIAWGDIPDHLTPLVDKLLQQGIGGDGQADVAVAVDMEFMRNMVQLQTAFAKAALIYPRLVDHPEGDDEFPVTLLEGAELQELWRLAMDPVLQLELFRDEQAIDGPGVRDFQADGKTTQ